MKEHTETFFHPKYLSHKMMRIVFSLYLVVALVITSIHFIAEYRTTQTDILNELEALENTFHTPLATTLWQMSDLQLKALAQGLISMPIIEGIDIINPAGKAVLELRDFSEDQKPLGIFSIEKNLQWTLNNQDIPLGTIKLYSSSDIVLDRVLFGFVLIALTAVIKIVLLWGLFVWAFQRFLGRPLQRFATQIDEIKLEDIEDKRIELGLQDKNELLTLQSHFNKMLGTIENDKQALILAEEKRRNDLEKEVVARTQELLASNEKLLYLASTDALTGIRNRRVFFEQAQIQMDLAVRQGTPLCLLVLDIDHFKVVNDTFGHSVGDNVLCHFVRLISSQLRATDLFGRVGGEEFAILLIDTELEDGVRLAEKLRKCICQAKLEHETKEISLSISIGASAQSEDDKNINDFFVRSDSLLYQAKNKGRNRVEK
jgi:diguanylate cyclase (GGDEF)-like protein